MSLPKSIKLPEQIIGQKSFVAEGVHFYVNTEVMSAEYAEEFLKLAPHMSVSMELLDVYALLKSIYVDLCNITKLGDAADIVNKVGNILAKTDKMSAGELVENQVNVVYKLCALCIVCPGEDTTKIDWAFLDKKIEIWRRQNDFLSFFLIARQLSRLFKKPSKVELEKMQTSG